MPPAMAGPSTAAISGLVSRKPLSSPLITEGSYSPDSNLSEGGRLFMDLRSAPAQKAPPAPVRMHTRTSGSEFTRSQACSMIASISPESALRTSGRFIVTTRVWPTSSTRQCGCTSVVLGRVTGIRCRHTSHASEKWNVF